MKSLLLRRKPSIWLSGNVVAAYLWKSGWARESACHGFGGVQFWFFCATATLANCLFLFVKSVDVQCMTRKILIFIVLALVKRELAS
jgi:hypothetical protein